MVGLASVRQGMAWISWHGRVRFVKVGLGRVRHGKEFGVRCGVVG